jgi:hypothetical protein
MGRGLLAPHVLIDIINIYETTDKNDKTVVLYIVSSLCFDFL